MRDIFIMTDTVELRRRGVLVNFLRLGAAIDRIDARSNLFFSR